MRLLVVGSGLVIMAACAACSGSSSSPDEPSQDQANVAPAPSSTAPAATQKQNPPPSETSPPKPTTPQGDGGAGEGGGGGGDGGGGGMNSQCAADSVHETESNDTPETANALPGATSSFCGTLPTAADVDYVAFTLPAGATKYGFSDSYSQQGVAVSVTVAGVEYPPGSTAPFKPGEKYTFKVHTTGNVPASYRVNVNITK